MVQLFKTALLSLIGLGLLGCANFPTGTDLEDYNFDPLSAPKLSLTELVDRQESEPVSDPIDFHSDSTMNRKFSQLEPATTVAASPNNNDFVAVKSKPETQIAKTRPLPLEPVKTRASNPSTLRPIQTPSVNATPSRPAQIADLPSLRTNQALVPVQDDKTIHIATALPTPPFANHPEIQPIDFQEKMSILAKNLKKPQAKRTGIAPATKPAEIDADEFINTLISETMDPESIPTSTHLVSTKKNSVSNAFTGMPSPLTWSTQLDKTILVFEAEQESVADHNRKLQLSNSLQILKSMKSNLDTGSDALSAPELKRYWEHQIDALQTIMTPSDQDWQSTAAVALRHLSQASEPLRKAAKLSLSSACLCRKVIGFGQYEIFPTTEFTRQQNALVYCEIENFMPIEIGNATETSFQTKISSSLWIEDDAGQTVQRTDFPAVSDYARKARTDFFMHVPIHFNQLEPGTYKLFLKVHDLGSNKVTTLDQPIQFNIR